MNDSVGIQYQYFYDVSIQQSQSHKGLLMRNSTNNIIATKGTTTQQTNTAKNCDSLNSSRHFQNELDTTNERKSTTMACVSPKRHDLEQSTGIIAHLSHKKAQSVDNNPGLSADDEKVNLNNSKMLKVRFLDKEFFKWEIRHSYNVQKLLSLQEKQRIFRKKTQSANEAMEKICMKSASCLNLQLIANKGMLYRPRGNPSLGRTLNRLLTTQKEQPKPEDLLKAQELRRQIEMAKFRCKFLKMERDRYNTILRKLHDKCNKISDENVERESWLMDDYRELSRSRDKAIEQRTLFMSRQKIFDKIKESLTQRQYQLLGQLRDIYIIKDHDQNGFYEINGICLPNTDSLRMYYNSNPPGTNNAALSVSVAMCYVAHVVLLCSSILNIPLR